MDEWEDLHGEAVDLDLTGDPVLDQFGYQSPRRKSPQPESKGWLAQARDGARRQAVANNLAETRRRNAERRGEPQPAVDQSTSQMPPPHIAQAVERGAPGRAAGWWKVVVAADGSAQWSKVDQPGDGPKIEATTQAPPAPQWHPVEMTAPDLRTRLW
jgi:hypothetical protein